jgi:hypothetical protein
VLHVFVRTLAGDAISDAIALIIQQDGKLVTAGGSNTGHYVLARFATGGSLDPGFGSGGIVEQLSLLQPDGARVLSPRALPGIERGGPTPGDV